MRAAVIFGPGSSPRDLRRFERESQATWLMGIPEGAGADAVLLLGGDGTLHRHLPRLVQLRLPLLVVPCGSGNDFARSLGLRTAVHSLAAWKQFTTGKNNLRTIDLGVVTPLGEAGADPGQRFYFSCVAGVGLDGEVALRASRLPRWLRAHGGYLLSLLPTLFRFAPFPLKISMSSDNPPGAWAVRSASPTILAAFANTPAYGGGMRIAPGARLDDGKLDACIVTAIGRMKLFCLFPTVYFGRHLQISEVRYFQAERLRVETETPREVYADGEFLCRTPVEVSVSKNALRVICAESGR